MNVVVTGTIQWVLSDVRYCMKRLVMIHIACAFVELECWHILAKCLHGSRWFVV